MTLDDLAALTRELANATYPDGVSDRKNLRKNLQEQIALLTAMADRLDPVLKPLSLFDPSDPETSARVTGLTMVAQPRHPLIGIRPFYGAGVYALYYRGTFEPYAKLAGSEQPLYVGKADPVDRNATDAVGQNQALYGRLMEHARSIGKATTTLHINDFDCRFLIVQSGFQQAAEAKLIDFFRPIWNSEVKICFGIGKHGDSAKTRANKRSPWDTVHPGRTWAANLANDQKPRHQIIEEIRTHLERYPPASTVADIVDAFVSELRQMEASVFQDAIGKPQEIDAPCGASNSDPTDIESTLF